MSLLNPIQKNKPVSLWGGGNSFQTLQQRINSLFSDFWGDSSLTAFKGSEGTFANFNPTIDVVDKGETFQVQAELPGLAEQDVEVTVEPQSVSIRGEKKFEKENKGKDYYHAERSYGVFSRVIPLPAEVLQDKAEATFKNGLLTVTLPKTPEAQSCCRKVAIKKG